MTTTSESGTWEVVPHRGSGNWKSYYCLQRWSPSLFPFPIAPLWAQDWAGPIRCWERKGGGVNTDTALAEALITQTQSTGGPGKQIGAYN